MRPEFQLILGCFGLGSIVAYALWSQVRVSLFRLDLGLVRDRLDSAMRLRAATDDPQYRWVRVLLSGMVEIAPLLYPLSLILYYISNKRTFDRHEPEPQICDGSILSLYLRIEKMPKEVKDALVECLMLWVRYCVFGCISGWLSLPILWLALATGKLRSWVREVPAVLDLVLAERREIGRAHV